MSVTKETCSEEHRKDAEDGGGSVHMYVSMNFWKCIRKAEFSDMDRKVRSLMHTDFFLFHIYTQASII